MGKKRQKPGVGTTYKGTVKTEGHDFIKDRISFAVDVSTVEELADAIAFELEKGQKAKRAISGEPFKIQFFDPEWGEYRDLRTLKPLSFEGCNGQLRLVLPDHSEPVKTKADWANKKIVFVRKDSIVRPEGNSVQGPLKRYSCQTRVGSAKRAVRGHPLNGNRATPSKWCWPRRRTPWLPH